MTSRSYWLWSPIQNPALCALIFLYRFVIGRRLGDLGEVVRARQPKRLPVVMTRTEVDAVLQRLNGEKWLMASLMYGAGLRLMQHLESVKMIHQRDLADGYGRVPMPYALGRKYPNAATDWRWQFVFPQKKRWRNRQTGEQGPSNHDLHAHSQSG